MRLLIITPSLEDNSLGRTYCLWLLADYLGWTVRVASLTGQQVWHPLRDTTFADLCAVTAIGELISEATTSKPDVVIAVKAHPESFGVALEVSRAIGRPLLLDYDDPDIEAVLSWYWRQLPKRIARQVVQLEKVRTYRRLRDQARLTPMTVSNPTLQRAWGGVVLPHVRPVSGELVVPAPRPSGETLRVAFVGTARRHKGVSQLRRAIASAAPGTFELVITAEAPPDAKPWEHWVGLTSTVQGAQLVADADVVCIPSSRSVFSRGQLPAKLIDAMLAGRPVVASGLPPIRWAAGGAALYSRPGSWRSLRRALNRLSDPVTRSSMGRIGVERALNTFSVEANAQAFSRAVRGVVSSGEGCGGE